MVITLVSLGCPKNQVDADILAHALLKAGHTTTTDMTEADVCIINTCGFITSAKEEAIENIFNAVEARLENPKLKIVVTGCLAERYRDEIMNDIPEVNAVVGIGSNGDICDIVESVVKGDKVCRYGKKTDLDITAKRIISTPKHYAYLKIAEGCSNGCYYCAIPMIRGPHRSRAIESCVEEAKFLAEEGVQEIIVVAQDITAYGEDIYGESKLPELLTELCKIEGLHWIRTLYTYPERITDKLLDTISKEDKLVKYLDIPIQHSNGDILKKMNRKGNRESLLALVEKIRAKIPNITLRTTLITGFPGETDEQFGELDEFVKAAKFDRLGCFPYSAEEDTIAAEMDGQIDNQTKSDRAEHIMETQLLIAREKNESRIDTDTEVLVEGYDDYIKCYFGRTPADAPEVDGKIFFLTPKPLVIGEYVNVHINDTLEYDLLGELAE
jgi:ribosomal protein S12 methylthiotransferase